MATSPFSLATSILLISAICSLIAGTSAVHRWHRGRYGFQSGLPPNGQPNHNGHNSVISSRSKNGEGDGSNGVGAGVDVYGRGRGARHVIPFTTVGPTLPPVFEPNMTTNVSVLAAKTAVLSCVVHNLAENSVSWIRHRDLHIITVGHVTYTNDDRFESGHVDGSGDWKLRLKYAQPHDTGLYDCQVSTKPLVSFTVQLNVIQPEAKVQRAPEMHVGTGSSINLTCIVSYSPETPDFLHWYHKDQMVRADGKRVRVVTQLGHRTISQLLIRNAQFSDNGLYTCSPANSKEDSILVHVLREGEYPAAMQGGSPVTCLSPASLAPLIVTAMVIHALL
ncbi:zwei Ig domain protein zig-8-like isoform X2 [Oratosquilla oratoria]|uniref:zwei Ig domain protein zig-8-like isoform X2 n=1 Tax=Oratosquilla oratoria TaxID=337810 RepID=UPI003F75CADE